jgi:Cu2+-exporting ATPase
MSYHNQQQRQHSSIKPEQDQGHLVRHQGHEVQHSGQPQPHMQQETGHQQHGVQSLGGMQHREHIDHTGHEELFRRRFWVSLMLSIPVLLYSPMVQDWLNFSMPEFSGSRWVTLVFSVVIFLYGGIPFLQMAGPELRQRKPGMMTLISMAISVAFVYSLAAFSGDFGEGFFWELVTLIDVMLLGHWLEMRSVRQASGALNELAKLMPDTAERLLPDGQTETVPASDLRVGDLILVRPGASVPADGEVVEGESEVNEAMITGESRPVPKAEGDRLIAGTVNGDGSLRVQVTAVGEETALAGIMRLVEEAQQSKSSTQVLADKAAGWLFYTAVAVAAITAVAWAVAVGLGGELIERVVTILVIACPHALGLAIPLVVAISTTLAARNGVLVRSRLALEEVRRADVVVFDKTGTLTRGEFGVSGLKASSEMGEDEALALTAAIEGDSEHIIARAIRGEAEARGLSLPKVLDFEVFKGRGVRAMVNGQSFYVGGPRLLEMLKLNLSPELADFTGAAGRKGQTVVYLASPDQVQAAFALADVIRTESREAVRRLKEMGVEVAMLTGDSRAVAEAVAVELGIQTYFAEVLPEHKDQKVVELQAHGKRVAMVGDGINDAPALIRADVGIAIGSGTDVAVESAGIILVRNNPLDVVKVMELSRASYRKMVQNLLWATGYNVVALPLAAGVLAPVGILLTPAVGALFMSLSTVIVAINAQFLRRIRLEKRPSTSAL